MVCQIFKGNEIIAREGTNAPTPPHYKCTPDRSLIMLFEGSLVSMLGSFCVLHNLLVVRVLQLLFITVVLFSYMYMCVQC